MSKLEPDIDLKLEACLDLLVSRIHSGQASDAVYEALGQLVTAISRIVVDKSGEFLWRHRREMRHRDDQWKCEDEILLRTIEHLTWCTTCADMQAAIHRIQDIRDDIIGIMNRRHPKRVEEAACA